MGARAASQTLSFPELAGLAGIVLQSTLSRRDIMKVARRFNAGKSRRLVKVPKGRPMGDRLEFMCGFCRVSAVPSGLRFVRLLPGVKTPGYSRLSLRDNRVTEMRNP